MKARSSRSKHVVDASLFRVHRLLLFGFLLHSGQQSPHASSPRRSSITPQRSTGFSSQVKGLITLHSKFCRAPQTPAPQANALRLQPQTLCKAFARPHAGIGRRARCIVALQGLQVLQQNARPGVKSWTMAQTTCSLVMSSKHMRQERCNFHEPPTTPIPLGISIVHHEATSLAKTR